MEEVNLFCHLEWKAYWVHEIGNDITFKNLLFMNNKLWNWLIIHLNLCDKMFSKKIHLVQFLVWWCNCIVGRSYTKISKTCVIVTCVSIICCKILYVKFDILNVGLYAKKLMVWVLEWNLDAWKLGEACDCWVHDYLVVDKTLCGWGSIPSRENGNWLVWLSNGLIFVRPWFLHGKLFHCHS